MNKKIYSQILNNTTNYIYIIDTNNNFIYINKSLSKLLNISPDKIIGKNYFDFFTFHNKKIIIEENKKILKGEKIKKQQPLKLKNHFKYEKVFYMDKVPFFDEDNTIQGIIGVCTDITNIKVLKNKLRNQKKFLFTILNNINAFVYLRNEKKEFVFINEKLKMFLENKNYKINRLNDNGKLKINNRITELFWKSDFKVINEIKRTNIEEIVYSKEKNKHILLSSKIPYKENNKYYSLSLSTDVTELKKQQDIINEENKLNELKEMIENITHQWRQPLSIISTISTGLILKKELKKRIDEEELSETLETIIKTVKDLNNTLDFFSRYLIKEKKEYKLYSIEKLIDQILKEVFFNFKCENITVIQNIENIKMYLFKNNLITVIISILKNSIDAFKQLKKKEKYIYIDIYEENNSIIFKIKDNAGGIDDEFIPKVFEPYTTTKFKGKDIGLGLFNTKNIIENYFNGKIFIENILLKDEKGTSVNITLPI